MTTLALGPEWLSPDYLIETFSLPGILLIVFAESGFFAFLPGDSLLFTAGLFVAEGSYITQPLWLVCTLIVFAAVLGDQVGYTIGKFFGPRIFSRPDSKLFKQENLEAAHDFMEKYGPKAIVLARFVPIVRTFAPITAGAGRMKYRTFLTYNLIGGVAWGSGVTLAGYWLGQIDFIKANVESILILIVFLSVVPIIVEYLRERAKKKRGVLATPDVPQQDEYDAYVSRQASGYARQPVMDDATTQLRRITPDGPQQQRQQAPQPQPPQQPYGNQGYPHQHQQQQPRPQQPYGGGQGGYDQYYGGQQYPQDQGGAQGQPQAPQGQGHGQDYNQQPPHPRGY
ncbi:DedA family protein [Streptomyces sp. NEAU-W12]|uniref:DedA family protein n=1 Tax=Streptomyces sp. NEAU-W12 TaxID=2994668 RepID=UPI00224B5C42|nr:VTT domain-containing protein [Streptomyces sp. NEAU-W12]MCX2927865.1 VTT domain-containing protein [Streptomyces sp. NEAU-W12]